MTRDWAIDVLLAKQDKDGNPSFLAASSAPAQPKVIPDRRAEIRRILWLQGWPEYRIPQRVDEIIAEQDAITATSRGG